ncbi:MAG: RluA family pseudouridine synthase [Oscillospiraceae bacterium]|nr:RluA family pseudouridine synthase [Oscillospiraceae bacterium]
MRLYERISPEDSQKTVYQVLKNRLMISTKLLKKLRDNNLIFLNGQSVFTIHRVREGDILTVDLDGLPESGLYVVPEDLPLDVLYEDECFIAINKAPNTVVHPTNIHSGGTIANALAYRYLKNGYKAKIHPVSRLDRDTSGVILFAKDNHSAHLFSRMHHAQTFEKEYIGIVDGIITPPAGEITYPIGRDPNSIVLRIVSPDGYPTKTRYETISVSSLFPVSLAAFYPLTGRTHQIRVHAKAIGHPIISDQLYGDDKYADVIPRQALHSKKLQFLHPFNKNEITIEAPLPTDIQAALDKLGLTL